MLVRRNDDARLSADKCRVDGEWRRAAVALDGVVEGDDPEQLFGNVNYGKLVILIPRGDYFQAGLIIRKGSFEEIRQRGMEEFREDIRRIAPYLGERVEELRDWEQVKLLSVQINRLRRWHRPGLLCIGDAAHAMSPAWGVGINLAIQDAVAAANILAEPLRQGRVTEALLAEVQQRREFPTKVTQALQVQAHKAFHVVSRNPGPARAPWQFKVVMNVPGVQHVAARLVGIGIQPEHIAGAKKKVARDGQRLTKIAVAAGLALAGVAIGWQLLRKARKPSFGWS